MNRESVAESTAKERTTGAVRCLYCFERISPPLNSKTYRCPNCGYLWRISWPLPGFPRLRGPEWSEVESTTQKILSSKNKK